jgi:hypothetical protein
MTIKHLVFSGGGPIGFTSYGIISQFFVTGYISWDNIKSIYGTSIGAILGAVLLLQYDWPTINEYIIKRPWGKIFILQPYELMSIYKNQGLFDIYRILSTSLTPLLLGKGLDTGITLQQFYEYTGVDYHLYTIEMQTFSVVDLSHKTHPYMSLVTALCMTSAVPFASSPIWRDGKCYIDGGILANYPIPQCILQQNCEMDEILGIHYKLDNAGILNINKSSNIIDIYNCVILHLLNTLKLEDHIPDNVLKQITYDVYINNKRLSLSDWRNITSTEKTRGKYIQFGRELADIYIQHWKKRIE